MPILVFLGLSALDLGPMYATNTQTDVKQHHRLMPPPIRGGGVRSLYLTTFQAIVAIGVVYVIAPPTWEDLTHLAISGLVDSSNEV